MSIRKPILKVTRECLNCLGTGKVFDDSGIGTGYEGDLGGFDSRIKCPYCKNGRYDVKKDHPDFKRLYQTALEQRVDDLTTEYRNAKDEAYKIAEELRKYCKELDKVVNK